MKIAPGTGPATTPTTDSAATARLVAALDVVLAASDAVSNAVTHFSRLEPGTTPPEAWVWRAVELHVDLLAAWWALDDLAAVDAAAGGWTVGPPHAVGNPVERRRTRVVWETDLMAPARPELWWDRCMHRLAAARSEAAVEEAGRALVEDGARRKYEHWTNTPEETT